MTIMPEDKTEFMKNLTVWSLAVIGWIYITIAFIQTWNDMSYVAGAGIAPPIQAVLYLLFQLAFYGAFVIAFPVVFILVEYDELKITKKIA